MCIRDRYLLILSFLRLSVPALCVTQSEHITITWNGHCACAVHVTYHRVAKMIHIFPNPWTQFTYSLCRFYGATTKIMPCYRRKIAFSHCKGYKVNCACAVSRDLCTWGPPKPQVTSFWPQTVYSLYNFYGATTTIKGSFILEHPHVKAVFGRKKVQSKSVPKMAVFRKFKGLNIKYSHRDPQKALPYPEWRVPTYFA